MKNVGTGISDKTREMTKNAKLAAEINGAKSNMEYTFAEIGKKYYAIYTDADTYEQIFASFNFTTGEVVKVQTFGEILR